MVKYNYKTDGKKITEDVLKKTRRDRKIRKNYLLVVNEAYTCIQQIMQSALSNNDILYFSKDFSNTIAYYTNKILNEFYTNKFMLPGYSINMFLAMLLFPNNEFYIKNKNNKQMLSNISKDIIKAKEEQIELEKSVFKNPCSDLFNEQFKGISDEHFRDVVDDFIFNVIKMMINNRIVAVDFASGDTKTILNIYMNKVSKSKKMALQFAINNYYNNKIYINKKNTSTNKINIKTKK